MGRYYLPKWLHTDRYPGIPRMHAIAAECHHVPSASDGAPETEDGGFRALTALIALSTDARAGEATRPLRHALGFARTRSLDFDPDNLAAMIDWFAPAVPFDFANVVIFVDQTCDLPILDMQSIVSRLRGSLLSQFKRVLVVCDEPLRWVAVEGVSGFVVGAKTTDANCAAMLFLVLATDMAPQTLTCLDLEDAGFSADCPGSPSILAQAIWIKDNSELHYASPRDRQVVSEANTVVMVPLMPDMKLSEVHRICSLVRADASPRANFLYAAPEAFDPFEFLHSRFASIVLLCS